MEWFASELVRPSKIEMPGSLYSQTCAALPNGCVYVTRWSIIVQINPQGGTEVWSGSVDERVTKFGHRKKDARYTNLHAICSSEDRLIVYDTNAHILIQIHEEMVSKIAGSGSLGDDDGPVDQASFSSCWGIVVTPSGHILMTDIYCNTIRMISPDGIVSTICGSSKITKLKVGPLDKLDLGSPYGICLAPDGYLYLTCESDNSWNRISPDLKELVSIDIPETALNRPESITVDSNGIVYICNYGGSSILAFNPTLNAFHNLFDCDAPRGVCISSEGRMFVSQNVGSGISFHLDVDSSIKPYRPPVHNTSLFEGNDPDFVGFERVLDIRLSMLIDSSMTNDAFSSDAWRNMFPTDSSLTNDSTVSLHWHSYIMDFLLKSPLEVSIFEGLTNDQESYNLADIFLVFLYSCGNRQMKTLVPEIQVSSACVKMLIVMERLGFVSYKLESELRNTISQNSHISALNLYKRTAEILSGKSPRVLPILSEIVSAIDLGIPKQSVAVNINQPDVTFDYACRRSLREYGDNLSWSEDIGAVLPADTHVQSRLWVIGIEGYDQVLYVHDWVLYCRWLFFRRLIDAGLMEVQNRRVELPSDTPPQFLLALMKYFYGSKESFNLLQEETIWLYLPHHAFELGLVDIDDQPAPGLKKLFAANPNPIIAHAI